MTTARFNEDKRKLVEALESLPKNSATRSICLLALGAISVIREDYSQWPSIESMVFNATVLFFCKEKLADNDLAEMINSGIQIDDLKKFTDDPVRFTRITDDVKAHALRLFSREE